jgi:hypothetical protein
MSPLGSGAAAASFFRPLQSSSLTSDDERWGHHRCLKALQRLHYQCRVAVGMSLCTSWVVAQLPGGAHPDMSLPFDPPWRVTCFGMELTNLSWHFHSACCCSMVDDIDHTAAQKNPRHNFGIAFGMPLQYD